MYLGFEFASEKEKEPECDIVAVATILYLRIIHPSAYEGSKLVFKSNGRLLIAYS